MSSSRSLGLAHFPRTTAGLHPLFMVCPARPVLVLPRATQRSAPRRWAARARGRTTTCRFGPQCSASFGPHDAAAWSGFVVAVKRRSGHTRALWHGRQGLEFVSPDSPVPATADWHALADTAAACSSAARPAGASPGVSGSGRGFESSSQVLGSTCVHRHHGSHSQAVSVSFLWRLRAEVLNSCMQHVQEVDEQHLEQARHIPLPTHFRVLLIKHAGSPLDTGTRRCAATLVVMGVRRASGGGHDLVLASSSSEYVGGPAGSG